jgi:WD40 repeat protein
VKGSAMRRWLLLVLLITLCFSVLPSVAQESECPGDLVSEIFSEILPPRATGVPVAYDVITPENAASVDLIGSLGVGQVKAVEWISDSSVMVRGNETLVYDANNLTAPPRLPNSSEIPNQIISLKIQGQAVIDCNSGQTRFYLLNEPLPDLLAISDDNTLLAYAYRLDEESSEAAGYAYPPDVVHLVDARTGTTRAELLVGGYITSMDFSPDQTQLAVSTWTYIGGLYEGIRLWDITEQRPIRTLEQTPHAGYWNIVFNQDGTKIAGGSGYGALAVWYTEDGAIQQFLPPTAYIEGLEFSADGEILASRNYSGWQLWHVETGAGYPLPNTEDAYSPFIGLDIIHAGYQDPDFWDVHGVFGNGNSEYRFILFSPHQRFAIAYKDDQPYFVDLSYGPTELLDDEPVLFLTDWIMLIRERDNPPPFQYSLVQFGPDSVLTKVPLIEGENLRAAFNPDTMTLATSEPYPGIVTLWDMSQFPDQIVPTFQLDDPDNTNDNTLTMTFSHSGELLAVAGDPEIRIWNVETGELLTVLLGHQEAIEALAFSPDDTLLASAGSGGLEAWHDITQESTIRLWGIPAA